MADKPDKPLSDMDLFSLRGFVDSQHLNLHPACVEGLRERVTKLLTGWEQQAEKIERLQAVVAAALPKCWRLTKQGELVKDKPITDRMTLFELGQAPTPCRELEICQIVAHLPQGDKFHSCYDTLEAAEAAVAEGKN